MRILFITTLNLASNPRFFKEINLALSAGYSAEVICFEFNNWSYNNNQKLNSQLSAAAIHVIPGNRYPFFPWFKSVALEFSFRLLGYFFNLSDKNLSQAVSRRSMLILEQLRKIKNPVDLVIGHHPGAIYPTVVAAKNFGCPSAFDVEDYHPGEGKKHHELKLIKQLMCRLLPKMIYTSFASPQILKKTKEDLNREKNDWFIIYNQFLSTEFTYAKPPQTETLELVWFSQNINFYRGLEQIIPVLARFKTKINLTLIGNKKIKFYNKYVRNNISIKLIDPLEQSVLHKTISSFDIGLAVEPGKDKNNVIALSNKILTYFQSGLYILASNTPAQADFFSKFPDHGQVINLKEEEIANAFELLCNNVRKIRQEKKQRFDIAKDNSWENESKTLLHKWKEILS